VDHNQILAFIYRIHDDIVQYIDPALLIPPEELELEPLTAKVINQEAASLHSVSKIIATSAPNKIFIKQSWSGYKDVRPNALIHIYSILIEAKHNIPAGIIGNSIPHIIILYENQKDKQKIEIMIWQQLFEKGDIFLGRRACLSHKKIPPINVDDYDLKALGEEKKDIDLGSYWAGYVASYATANNKNILEAYCSVLSTLLSDRTINFPAI